MSIALVLLALAYRQVVSWEDSRCGRSSSATSSPPLLPAAPLEEQVDMVRSIERLPLASVTSRAPHYEFVAPWMRKTAPGTRSFNGNLT